MTAQLLRTTDVYYGTKEGPCFQQDRGVPQGGVLSPMLFEKTLDFILRKQQEIVKHIEKGELIAFADDICLTVDRREIGVLRKLFDNFKDHGMEANTKKCEYLSEGKIDEMEEFGVWKPAVRYLGKMMSLSKITMRKLLKDKLWSQALAWSKTFKYLPVQPGRV